MSPSKSPELQPDRRTDAALRDAARRIELPVRPSARRVREWMRDAPGAEQPEAARRRGWRPRAMTWAGSAVAASVAFAAFLIAPGGNSRVEAAMILNSFRQTILDGFRLSFGDLGEDGVRVSGDVTVIPPAGGVAGDPGAAAINVTVSADEGALEDLPWSVIHVAAALGREQSWVYLQTSGLNVDFLDDNPVIAVIDSYTDDGLFLVLDELVPTLKHEILGELGNAWQDVRAELLSGEADDEPIVVRINGADGDAVRVTSKHNVVIHTRGDDDDDNDIDIDFDAGTVQQVVRRLITGEATADELLVALEPLAEHGHLEVVEVEPGLHVLRISDIEVDAGDADAAMIAALEIEVRYQEGFGVVDAEIRHLGAYDGWVRFHAADVSDAATLLAPDRYLENARTTVFDLGQFAPLLQKLGAEFD